VKFLLISLLLLFFETTMASSSKLPDRCEELPLAAAVLDKSRNWLEEKRTGRLFETRSLRTDESDVQGCCVEYLQGPDYCFISRVCMNTESNKIYRYETENIPWCGY